MPGPYIRQAGYCYTANIASVPWAEQLAELADSNSQPLRSPVCVAENQRTLSLAHAAHKDIAEKGGGRYSHWGSTIYFSASDNSDPNINGHAYTLVVDRDFQDEARIERRLEELLSGFLRARLQQMGKTESGLYDYYAASLDRGEAFKIYDRPVAQYVSRHANRYARCIEVGAGIGQLPALLAALGLPAVAVEADTRRVDAAIALNALLSREMPGFAGKLSVIEAFFPSDRVRVDRDTLILMTNLMNGDADAQAERILEGCAAGGGLIIDLCRFGHGRTTTDSWRDLIRRIRDLGFPYVDPVFSWGDPTAQDAVSPACGRIVYFHSEASLR